MTRAGSMQRRLLLLAALLLTLWVTWQVGHEPQDASVVGAPAASQRRLQPKPAASAAVRLPLQWPDRTDLGPPVADLFNLPAPPPVPQAAMATAMPVLVPPLQVKFMGRLDGIQAGFVFLTDANDRVITAKPGQSLGGGWQLASMDQRQLVFRHEPSGQLQTILIGATQ